LNLTAPAFRLFETSRSLQPARQVNAVVLRRKTADELGNTVMSALVFSHYYLTGNEGSDFQVGARPVLDEYDGFFDQALDALEPGDQLFFLLNDGFFSPASRIGSRRACRELRDRLDRAPMITGHLVEATGSPFVLQVDKREPFLEVIQRKVLPTSNEAVGEVARYMKIWEAVRDGKRRMGQEYRFRLVCQLPSVSSVEQALEDGLHCVPQMDFGPQPPNVAYGFPLFLESLVGTRCVRVIALGDNDIDSCRVLDLTDPEEYRQSIRERHERAELTEEVNCWKFLLE
jgi:hypothetical protein